jgi:hypothetical protein
LFVLGRLLDDATSGVVYLSMGRFILVFMIACGGGQRCPQPAKHDRPAEPKHCEPPARIVCVPTAPPELEPMTGDEVIDRLRREHHRRRLVSYAQLAHYLCGPS